MIKLTFNRGAFLIALALFGIEVSIATVLRDIAWIRGFLGDVLAVVFVYYGLKAFVRVPSIWLAFCALLTAYAVELSQLIASQMGWKVSNPIIRIVVGSTADWWDVTAYTLGFFAIILFEWTKARMRRAVPLQ
jgi:hypothetical protein